MEPRLVVSWTLGDTACKRFVVALAASEVCRGVPALCDRTHAGRMPDGRKHWGSIADGRWIMPMVRRWDCYSSNKQFINWFHLNICCLQRNAFPCTEWRGLFFIRQLKLNCVIIVTDKTRHDSTGLSGSCAFIISCSSPETNDYVPLSHQTSDPYFPRIQLVNRSLNLNLGLL